MGCRASTGEREPFRGMRQWPTTKVHKSFKYVRCPYPEGQTMPGRYGSINYTLSGPQKGELCICIHGLNGSRMLFQDLAAYLARQDYQVLCYDLYGHGLSNAPKPDLCCCQCSAPSSCGPPRGKYDLDFFCDQIEELLANLGVKDPFTLIGFSLGGAIIMAYAKRYPEKVKKLVAMSPAGFLPKVPKVYWLLRACFCCIIPLAPFVLCPCMYRKDKFQKNMKGEDEEFVESLWTRLVWLLFIKRGVASATLAVANQIPWMNLRGMFEDVGRHSRPVLLVWGERDQLNPVSPTAQEVLSCFSNAKLFVVKGAAHISLQDQPRQVRSAVLSFLQLPDNATVDEETDLSNPIEVARPKRPDAASRPSVTEEPRRDIAAAAQMPMPVILGFKDSDHDQQAPHNGTTLSERGPCVTNSGSGSTEAV